MAASRQGAQQVEPDARRLRGEFLNGGNGEMAGFDRRFSIGGDRTRQAVEQCDFAED
jgi:hypothetical protein